MTTTPTTPVYTPQTLSDNVGGAHTTVVSIGVMLLVVIILIEIAGTNHSAAVGVGFLLLAAISIAAMNASPHQLQTIASYPAIPQQ